MTGGDRQDLPNLVPYFPKICLPVMRFKKVLSVQTKMVAKSLLIVLLLGFALFMAGLQHFILTLPQPAPVATSSDGIVVITGGQQRLADGFNLLQSGAGKALLVSGVGKVSAKPFLPMN